MIGKSNFVKQGSYLIDIVNFTCRLCRWGGIIL